MIRLSYKINKKKIDITIFRVAVADKKQETSFSIDNTDSNYFLVETFKKALELL